ncbi:hypothetical protein A1O3_02947 [Capronia epimyces CBS 606.96]|uniref:Major facilitator superfamily (MFS) profile domain-containing protein n=1 Tax=Capronia epimyces CBS 606.96 TaxID=1182542 RepID=W9YJP0_9EURO|nr:uncharacterized protein A1O3_02947 [Capronia epimyces CBS 606.96]EXJ89880.1 hypothetical protein A1O3_02947 [Capronia epimyces CBS 606.96]
MSPAPSFHDELGVKVRHWNFRTFLAVNVMCIGAAAFGYAQGISGSTLGQPSFSLDMGLTTASNATQLISAMNALFYVGAFFGTVANGWIADRWGRKPSILLGTIIVLVSAALLAGSVNMAMFIVFRFFSGFGAYILAMSVPLWITETVPPDVRGIFAMFNGFFINIGYLLASYIGFGFYHYTGAGLAAWRGPIALNGAPCVAMLMGLYWMPESPRFLLMKGKDAEARRIVRMLHSSVADPDHYYAEKELFQMRKQIELDRTLDSSWLAMYKRPSYFRRMVMAFFVVFSIAASGAQVIANYASILFSNLGFGPTKQLLFYAGLYCASTPPNLLECLYIDRMSRTKLVAIGLIILACIMSVYTALTAQFINTTNLAGQKAAVAMLFIFFFAYAATVDGPTWFYTAELFPTHLRSKGMVVGTGTYALSSLVWVMSGPTAIKNIEWRFFLIFIILNVLSAIIIWIWFPDTKGKSLEEIAALFGDDDLVVVYTRDIHLDAHHHVVADLALDGGKSATVIEDITDESEKYGRPSVEREAK